MILKREIFSDTYTLGSLSINGEHFGYTCEDADRRLEDAGIKIKGRTAIPRGKYKVVLSHSNRFNKVMTELKDVPGFSGVRIHGGNTHEDTEGCPLLGLYRTETGVRECAAINKKLIDLVTDDTWIEII